MERPALILGLESSCDETAVALVDSGRNIRAQRIASQMAEHRPYGGVVPELAARAHVERLAPMVHEVLQEAHVTLRDVDAIAATAGPGLIGGVMVGLVTAKSLCIAAGKPLIAVNHLEGHALSARLVEDIAFPYWLLLVSGGHCQLLLVRDVGDYRRMATTIDDAAGEAFDKVAKMLGLGFPGGPVVERAAANGDAGRFALPRPMMGSKEPHFSFAGLKSAVHRTIETGIVATAQDRADMAAAFQLAVADCVQDRLERAFAANAAAATALVVAGGVAANLLLRQRLDAMCTQRQFRFVAPPGWLCTDNAAMIAWAGVERFARGWVDDLSAPARARWPLDASAVPARGAGVKA